MYLFSSLVTEMTRKKASRYLERLQDEMNMCWFAKKIIPSSANTSGFSVFINVCLIESIH